MTVVLAVGEGFHLKMGKDRIVYAGMPSEKVFSIVQRRWQFYQGYAWNLFFPKEQTELVIDGVRLTVESVSPQEIRLGVG
jgi:hypothetical protein